MSPGDDDISAALPRPPLPAPARREAAIAAAMRRFDGLGEPAPGRPAWAVSWDRRPYMGALAGAALVAVIALPLAWTSFDEQPYREARKPPAARAAPDPAPPAGDAIVAPPAPSRPPPGDRAPSAVPAAAPEAAPAPAPADAVRAVSEPAPVVAPPPPAEPAARQAEAQPDEAGRDQVVVTGTRIRRPNLEAAAPVTVIGDSAIGLAGSRTAAARSARRADWNACTVDDPGRSLAGCQVPAETADGLARAWKGDWEGASRAFDSAVAAAPRSSSAYLNRGLVRRRGGELERALADLDRAVRFSPRTARYYYHRSLILRQLGDSARARADETRAVDLDPRYSAVVPAEGRR